MDITLIYCKLDDFWVRFQPQWEKMMIRGGNIRNGQCRLSMSEIMCILVLYHFSNYKNFKSFYIEKLLVDHQNDFPDLVSYNRFIEIMERSLIPLTAFFDYARGQSSGINFVDSMDLPVCHIKREKQHKVFSGMARKGKTSVGWFYGLKLHIIINEKGEIIDFAITPGNVHDVNKLKYLSKRVWGKIFGDKGYISKKIMKELEKEGKLLITRVRKNMKPFPITPEDKELLKKRSLVETVFGLLQNACDIDHTRHRKPMNAIVHIMGGLIAYFFRERKPSLRGTLFNFQELCCQ